MVTLFLVSQKPPLLRQNINNRRMFSCSSFLEARRDNQAVICYTQRKHTPMSRHIIPIDANNLPDLLKVAEEVKTTKTPRLIKRNGEALALLLPTGRGEKRSHPPQKRTIWTHYDPQQVKAALQASAGALQGVSREELVSDLAEQRGQESAGRLF